MQLEKVTAEIRPRGKWESIDLGCALVRENFGKVLLTWMVVGVPLWMMIVALGLLVLPAGEGRPWLIGLFCVWVVPFYDRVILFVLSRKLFGEDVTWKGILKVLLTAYKRRFIVTLFCGPFAMSRGLSMPVFELEGLKGKTYKERVALLSRNGGEGAMQVNMVGLVLVVATVVSLLFVLFSFLSLFGDTVVVEEFWLKYVEGQGAEFLPVGYVWVLLAMVLGAITIVEPFCVGAGFAIYINSRTLTEGWDIELAFKRMNERVKSVSSASSKVLLGILLMGLTFFSVPVEASNARLEKVMQDEDFVVHTEIVEENVDEEKNLNLGAGAGGLGGISWILFWVIVAGMVGVLIWLIIQNAHAVRVTGMPSLVGGKVSRVETVMGMNVTPESLPADIVKAAKQALEEGGTHLALQLLYRGALSRLVHDFEVAIESSDTESDCLRRVEEMVVKHYFGSLTGAWMQVAYGGMALEREKVLDLCNHWPFDKVLSQQEGGAL